MDIDVQDAWLNALRSDKYVQGTGFLNGPDGHCCLGVLCDLAEQAGMVEGVYDKATGVTWYDDSMDLIPDSVRIWAGLDSHNPVMHMGNGEQVSLADLNDGWIGGPWSFAAIADVIAEQL